VGEVTTERVGHRRNPEMWVRNLKQVARNSRESKVPGRRPCAHARADCNRCSVSQLTNANIENFVVQLYQHKTAAAQNNFLAQYIVPFYPVSSHPRNETPRKRMQNQYFVRKTCGRIVVVCTSAFQGITSMTHKRLNTISTNFIQTGESPTER